MVHNNTFKTNARYLKLPLFIGLIVVLLTLIIRRVVIQKTQLNINTLNDKSSVETIISAKPRGKIILYQVVEKDSIADLAEKFGISENTIKWANNLNGDVIEVGVTLKILPVTGVMHTVAKGETVYVIATKYHTTPEKITNYPFNDFKDLETFGLTQGQVIMVPDGIKGE